MSLAGVRRHFIAICWTQSDVFQHLYQRFHLSTACSSEMKGDTLGRRLLSLVYPKRSAVVTIHQWADEGRSVRKYELNRVVRELRKHNRFKHALEICEWMTLQQNLKLLSGDYAVHLDLIAKVRGIASAEKFFEDLPSPMKEQSTYTALLHTYVQNKLTEKAEALMDKMLALRMVTNPLPYNHMLNLYIANGDLDMVPIVVQQLKKNTSPDLFTYNLMIGSCAINKDVKGAEKLLHEMNEKIGDADWVTYSKLTNIYINAGHLEKAKNALKEMETRISQKERGAYRSLMTLYASLNNKDDVFRIWRNLKMIYRKMSDIEYLCMLSSLVKVDDLEAAENIYTEWNSVSPTYDARIPNVLLGAYVKKDMFDEAESFHRRLVKNGIKPSYNSWELLAMAYLKKKDMCKALDALAKAISSVTKWEPNQEIIREVLRNLEILGDIEGVERFLVMLRGAGCVTTEVYNCLLRTYAKAGKMPLIVTERMKKDEVQLNEETRDLLKSTKKLPVGQVPSTLI